MGHGFESMPIQYQEKKITQSYSIIVYSSSSSSTAAAVKEDFLVGDWPAALSKAFMFPFPALSVSTNTGWVYLAQGRSCMCCNMSWYIRDPLTSRGLSLRGLMVHFIARRTGCKVETEAGNRAIYHTTY